MTVYFLWIWKQGKYTKALSNGYKDVAKKTQEAAKATKDYEQSLKRLRKAQNELNKKCRNSVIAKNIANIFLHFFVAFYDYHFLQKKC